MPNETMTLISTITISGTAANVTFSSIPQNFTDLRVVISGRGSRSGTFIDDMLIRINGSTANQYVSRYLYTDGSGTPQSLNATTTYGLIGLAPASTATANTFGQTAIYIPDYRASTNKTIVADSVMENNSTSSRLGIFSASWNNSAAVSSILLFLGFTAFEPGTVASLYGVVRGSGEATVAAV